MCQLLCDLGLMILPPLHSELSRSEIAMSGVRPVEIVIHPVILNNHPRLKETIETPHIQQLIPETAVERLDPRVLPR